MYICIYIYTVIIYIYRLYMGLCRHGGFLPNKVLCFGFFAGPSIFLGGPSSRKIASGTRKVGSRSQFLTLKPLKGLHYSYSSLRSINHSEIGAMFTNLAIERGPHIVLEVFTT